MVKSLGFLFRRLRKDSKTKMLKFLIPFYWMKQLRWIKINWKFLSTREVTPAAFSGLSFIFSMLTRPPISLNLLSTNNYSATEEFVMDKRKSRILCPINASVIRKTLSVPDDFVLLSHEYKEENIIHFFQESTVESKESFLNSCPSLIVRL